MANDTDTIVHEWFEQVWNQGSVEAIDRLLADDAVIHGLTMPDGSEVRGPAPFKLMHTAFRQAFPGNSVTVLRIPAKP